MELAELKAAIDGYQSKAEDGIKALNERLDGIEARNNRSHVFGGKVDDAKLADEHKALATFARTGDDSEIKAMSVGSDPDGGYTVLPVMAQTMIRKLRELSPMRRLARVETIGTGDGWEELLDTDESGASWVGETETRPATDTPQLGKILVPLNEIYANQTVTQRLLDDSSIDIGAWLEGKISDKFARSEGTAFVSGDGIKKPKGLLSYDKSASDDDARDWGTLQYVPTGEAADFPALNTSTGVNPADVLKNLLYAVRAPYRPGSTWVMNSNTANRIDKFKDGQGDYIWRTGMTAGAQSSLLGYPVEFDEDMPDVGAGAFPIAFGNFNLAYLIIDRPGLKMLRDPYSNKPNVQFYAYRRVGGGLANSEAVKLLKVAAS